MYSRGRMSTSCILLCWYICICNLRYCDFMVFYSVTKDTISNESSALSFSSINTFCKYFIPYCTCIYVFHHRWQCGKTSVWWSCSTGEYCVMLHQLESFIAGVKWIIKLFLFIQVSGYILVCLEYSVYFISIRLVCWDYLSFPLYYYGLCAVTTNFYQLPKDSRLLDCIK